MGEPPDHESSSRTNWIEIAGVALIALTAVLTAWTAFEASKWGGEMSIQFSVANSARTESVRASNLANRQTTIDVALFSDYVTAVAQEDDELAEFFRQRFPDRLAVAVDAWLETDPLGTADAPGSPFDVPEYSLSASAEAADLEADAAAASTRALDANQRSDNYTITTVFLATVILLAALSSKVGDQRIQITLLGLAVLVFVVIGAIVATFPVLI